MKRPKYAKKSYKAKCQFLDDDFHMKEAQEPTNIKWENWDKTRSMQTKRKIAVTVAIAVLLLGAFASFYLLKRQTITNYQKYPPTTDCETIVNMFQGNFSDPEF